MQIEKNEVEKEPEPIVQKSDQQLFGRFIENLKIKSILCFSEIIIYYGFKDQFFYYLRTTGNYNLSY